MRFIVILILGALQHCSAGFDPVGAGSRARALGGAFTAVPGDIWALSFNVGGLARLGQNEVSFFYSPSPFGLRELSVEAGALGIPTSLGVIGVAVGKFGYELYQEITATIAYSNSISRAGFGLCVNYHSARIRRYGSAGTLDLDAGILVDASPQLKLGLSIKNANGSAVGASREPLPQMYAIGASYAPAQTVLLLLELRKESGYELSPRFGFECWIAKAIALRGGFSDVAPAYTGGVGIRYAYLGIDYAFTAHQDLGWTHDLTLSVRWGSGHD